MHASSCLACTISFNCFVVAFVMLFVAVVVVALSHEMCIQNAKQSNRNYFEINATYFFFIVVFVFVRCCWLPCHYLKSKGERVVGRLGVHETSTTRHCRTCRRRASFAAIKLTNCYRNRQSRKLRLTRESGANGGL